MKKVTINGVSYLGDLKESKDGMTLKKAMMAKDASRMNLAKWLAKDNLDELETLEFGGNGVSYTVADLSDDEKMNLEIGILTMKAARGKAVKDLENKMFAGMLGN